MLRGLFVTGTGTGVGVGVGACEAATGVGAGAAVGAAVRLPFASPWTSCRTWIESGAGR